MALKDTHRGTLICQGSTEPLLGSKGVRTHLRVRTMNLLRGDSVEGQNEDIRNGRGFYGGSCDNSQLRGLYLETLLAVARRLGLSGWRSGYSISLGLSWYARNQRVI